MSQDFNSPDPDDFFQDTRMSFGEHIEDLRGHLIRAIKGFVFALIIGFVIGKPMLRFIAKPVEEQLGEFYAKQKEEFKKIREQDPRYEQAIKQSEPVKIYVLRSQLKAALEGKSTEAKRPDSMNPEENKDVIPLWISYSSGLQVTDALEPAQSLYAIPPTLKTLSVQEAFLVYIKVSFVSGLILGSPWIFWQVWMFVAAGLYPHEKKIVYKFIPFSLGLFLSGVVICEFIVIPKAVGALLWFNEWLGLQPDLRLSEWLGFAIMLPLVFGLAFQTPIVVFFIARLGIIPIESMRAKRKIVCFVLAAVSAFITPSDPYSMVFLWVPMYLLFELGIWMAARAGGSIFGWEEDEEHIEV